MGKGLLVYVPRGFGFSEVGDVEVFPHGDELHLFHLTLPNHDLVQHAVSTDGLSWRELPGALRTSDPGDCDDDQIWTMSVTGRDGDFVMVYTALSKAEDGQVQRTAVATSSDLITWRKHPANPVAAADPRWYEADLTGSGRVSWRDPKPVLIDGTYHAVVAARVKDGPLVRRGCVGLMTSPDLETWTVQPPLMAPGRYWDMECPQLFVIDGVYYLTASIMEDRSQRYWLATDPAGPFTVPPDGGILAPSGHYAGRVCTWQGRHLFVCWHQPAAKAGPSGVDWTTVSNQSGKFVVAPLVLSQRPDRTLARQSFPGWTTYHQAAPSAPAPVFGQHPPDPDSNRAARWSLNAPAGRMETLVTGRDETDLHATGRLRLGATTWGMLFRFDPATSDGYTIELQAGTSEVLLKKWLLRPDPRTGRPWFRMETLQRGQLARPLSRDTALPFSLILSGPYVELELDGQVVIATLSAERTSGRFGIWAESGTIEIEDLRTAPLRPLVHS